MVILKFFLILAILFLTGQSVLSQRSTIIGQAHAFAEAADITQALQKNCTNKTVYQFRPNLTLEILYDRSSTGLHDKINEKLRDSVSMSFDLVKRGNLRRIQVYIAKFDKLPLSYQVAAAHGVDFVYPIAYDSRTEMNSNCAVVTDLCDTIYRTIPHELTHLMVEGLFSSEAKWIEEGLAEYVSGLVTSKLSPRQAYNREIVTMPEIALHSASIRDRLFQWDYHPSTMNEESVLFYGASHQLARQIFAVSRSDSEHRRLAQFFSASANAGSALTSNQVKEVIQSEFGIDVTQLGQLSVTRETELYKNAVDTYILERNKSRTAYKYKSLITIAYIDKPISDEFLRMLIDDLFDKKYPPLLRKWTAISLARRMDNTTFSRLQASRRVKSEMFASFNSWYSFRSFLLNQ